MKTTTAFPLAGFKASPDDDAVFSGYASVFESVDAWGDIVTRGAFDGVLDDFLREGFISWGTAWDTPVAMPIVAREDAVGLWLAGRFHSTEEAQRARTITLERSEKGLRTGLAITYEIASYRALPGNQRAITSFARLFNVGLVMVPANPDATVRAVKRLDPTCVDDACVLDAIRSIEQGGMSADLAAVMQKARSLGVQV